jgi:integrase
MEVPADGQVLLGIMDSIDGQKKISRRRKEMSRTTWRGIRSDIWVAFDIAKLPRPVLRQDEVLMPEWAELLDILKAGEERKDQFFVKARKGLSPLIRFCSSNGVLPYNVNEAVLERVLILQCQRHVANRAQSITRNIARLWNEAIEKVPGWPKIALRVPEADKYESPPWSTYPHELLAKIEDYRASRTEEMTFEACIEDTAPDWEYDEANELPPRGHNSRRERQDRRVLRSSSADKERRLLRVYFGALVEIGVPPQEMANLGIVLDPSRVARGLSRIQKRIGPKKPKNSHLRGIANALVGFAEWAVERGLVPPQWPDKIRKMRNLAQPDYSHLTEKNQRFVNRLEDETFRQTFQCLPDILIEESEAEKKVRKDKEPKLTAEKRARLYQTAAIVELALATGLRVSNLASLDLEQHFDTIMGGQTSIIIPGEQMKNGDSVNIPLSDETVKIIEFYRSHHRGHLAKGPTTKLFPGKSDGHIGTGTIRDRIYLAARRHLGCKMTPHQFRHAIARLIDDSEPDAPGLAAKVLGQRGQGAIRHYMERHRRGAFRRFNEIRNANRGAYAKQKGNDDVL